ncbi:MAG: aminoglycoside phosphotransferase family protein [Candidatus Promineifilaceae bacterium]|nr:aminoglycoside phosphotransferase family protein [Anaerolineaceae bacterium]
MEFLQGGRKNKIGRIANTVHRPAGPWTQSVHALLRQVRAAGFTAVPHPLGFDEAGNEIVTFLAGDVCNYPLSAAAASQEALVSAAQLLRAYHEASRTFLAQNLESHTWLLPSQTPIEVICHGDFAPYNVVLNGRLAVGLIDFDTAHPGPRIWDIAYALYRWAPFTHPQNPDRLGNLETQIERARLFCDAYGFPVAQRHNLVEMMILRLETLVTYMQAEAQKGNEAFIANLADGHHLLYRADIEYLGEKRPFIQKSLHR